MFVNRFLATFEKPANVDPPALSKQVTKSCNAMVIICTCLTVSAQGASKAVRKVHFHYLCNLFQMVEKNMPNKNSPMWGHFVHITTYKSKALVVKTSSQKSKYAMFYNSNITTNLKGFDDHIKIVKLTISTLGK